MEYKTGRPTKYKPEYCDLILDYVGRQGNTVCQFAMHVGVAESTVWYWGRNYPEFSAVLEKAIAWSKAYWYGELREMMLSKDVNAPLVKLYLANRFGMTDRDGGQDKASESETSQLEQQIAKASERLWGGDDD